MWWWIKAILPPVVVWCVCVCARARAKSLCFDVAGIAHLRVLVGEEWNVLLLGQLQSFVCANKMIFSPRQISQRYAALSTCWHDHERREEQNERRAIHSTRSLHHEVSCCARFASPGPLPHSRAFLPGLPHSRGIVVLRRCKQINNTHSQYNNT